MTDDTGLNDILISLKQVLRREVVAEHEATVLRELATIIDRQKKMEDTLRGLMELQERTLRAATAGMRVEIAEFLAQTQLSMVDTVKHLKTNRLSFSRYGDGELETMVYFSHGIKFQVASAELSADLKAVITFDGYDREKLMIGLPDLMPGNTVWEAKWPLLWPPLKLMLDDQVTYGNAMVSRPQFFRHFGESAVKAWRELWEGEDICFITGEGSRFEPVEGLFSNSRSQTEIFSTPVNAYDDLERVIDVVKQTVPRQTLCLIALGPAGTILAAKLSNAGYWALDVGHISNSYSQIFEGKAKPEKLPVARKV